MAIIVPIARRRFCVFAVHNFTLLFVRIVESSLDLLLMMKFFHVKLRKFPVFKLMENSPDHMLQFGVRRVL